MDEVRALYAAEVRYSNTEFRSFRMGVWLKPPVSDSQDTCDAIGIILAERFFLK